MPFYKTYTTETCFPEPVELNGAFNSVADIITTNIVSELSVGDYLYSTTNNELRKIINVTEETVFQIESSFTADVTNEQINIADKTILYTTASVAVINTVDGLFNGQTFPKRTVIDIEEKTGIYFTISGVGTKISVLATP